MEIFLKFIIFKSFAIEFKVDSFKYLKNLLELIIFSLFSKILNHTLMDVQYFADQLKFL